MVFPRRLRFGRLQKRRGLTGDRAREQSGMDLDRLAIGSVGERSRQRRGAPQIVNVTKLPGTASLQHCPPTFLNPGRRPNQFRRSRIPPHSPETLCHRRASRQMRILHFARIGRVPTRSWESETPPTMCLIGTLGFDRHCAFLDSYHFPHTASLFLGMAGTRFGSQLMKGAGS